MNILEQLPPKSSPTNETPSSAFFNFFKSNKEEEEKEAYPSLSDHILKYDLRSLVIMTLLIIIVLAFFGFNVMNMFGNGLQSILDAIHPLVAGITSLVRKSTGHTINAVAKVSADVSKGGIDLAEGAVEDVGNIIIGDEATGKSNDATGKSNEGFVGSRIVNKESYQEPEPDYPEDTIQKARGYTKTKWCLSGEYQDKRGCVPVSESAKCLTGQTFSNEKCIN
jgi:hypothetical protein